MKDYTIVQMQKGERKRCRQWRIDLKDGRYPSGKQKYKSRKFEGTYTQAVKLAEELSEDRSRLRSKWTVETYFRHVNDAKLATGQISRQTHDSYESSLKVPLEIIGGLNLSEVRPSDVERMYVRLRGTRTRQGEGWSGTSVHNAAKILRNVFEFARREKLVSENPFDEAMQPRRDTEEREAMSFEDAVRFERGLDPTERHQLAVIIQMETGLRIGEVCGLRWEDVRDGYVHVRRTVHRDGTTGDPKTRSSVRVVPVSATLAEALGAAPRHSEWVVGGALGEPMRPAAMANWWARARDGYGLPGWTLHQFRHQFATNMARQGVNPRTMAALLGHSSPVVSLSIYTHVEKAQTVDVIAQLEEAKQAVA